MSSATSGFGTLLKMGDGASPEVFTTVAEVTNIAGPSLATESIDVTSHDSASNHREHIPSLRDAGELSFSVNYLPGDNTHKQAATGLLGAYQSRTVKNWELVFPDAATTTWSLTGFINGFSPTGPTDDKLSADVSIKMTAAPTLV